MAQKSAAAAWRRTTQKKAGKALRKLHPITIAVAVFCLILGIAAGVLVCRMLSANDTFVLLGSSAISLDAGAEGETYLYTEEGVRAVTFGMDISDTYKAETSLQQNEAGQYVIPLDRAGVYSITYTVGGFKFGENAPNGAIKRVRTFTVTAAGEEDGRSE